MDRRKNLKADTERFVRLALSRGVDREPSEKDVRKATSEIFKAFKPVVSYLAKKNR